MQELARILGALPMRLRRDDARTALARAIWPRVAGGAIASHSRVVAVKRGSLRLEADGVQWADAIAAQTTDLVEALRQRYPALGLKRLQVEVGQAMLPTEPPAASAMPVAEPPQEIVRAAEAIRDPELRQALLRTAGAYLARKVPRT